MTPDNGSPMAADQVEMPALPLVTVPVRLPDPNLYSPEVQEEMRLIMEGKRQ